LFELSLALLFEFAFGSSGCSTLTLAGGRVVFLEERAILGITIAAAMAIPIIPIKSTARIPITHGQLLRACCEPGGEYEPGG
jgi:hypothetical protein